ncbi:hypothetical protein EST62_11890 [Chlorobaculum sp. 24CR]|uniref:hypothetical protein n=1 Tax=Chlorobaculum sp. 24CR TaxID=2508878 RepID=UPI00100BE194|nr:hypothetical protein [Chlorobaculum sp. 24CR]RXK81641.1 hypothetical protein EST62_11890 [Chlorobaculum sp. 24CR]
MIKVPTDNLYKFMAVFGLVLIGLSIYVFVRFVDVQMVRNVDANSRITKLKIKDDIALMRLDDAIRNAQRREALGAKKTKDISAKSDSSKIIYDKMMGEVQNDIEIMGYYDKLYSLYLTIVIIFGVLGFILMLTGFVLWYIKLQKYLDDKIRGQGSVFCDEVDADV